MQSIFSFLTLACFNRTYVLRLGQDILRHFLRRNPRPLSDTFSGKTLIFQSHRCMTKNRSITLATEF